MRAARQYDREFNVGEWMSMTVNWGMGHPQKTYKVALKRTHRTSRDLLGLSLTTTRIRDAHCSISMLDEPKCQSGENTSDRTSYTLYTMLSILR